MDPYHPNTYGERIAGIYDELYSDYDPAAIAALDPQAKIPGYMACAVRIFPGLS